ncbi:MAG: hypothetical protein HY537_10690 [Deltaproteobacteria bacterium]|nr:hypothetical protein [Deltaproteobacteria bacterium]
MKTLTGEMMLSAFKCLDKYLTQPVRIIVGGGGAMTLAHHFPLSTADIDGIPAAGMSVTELDCLIKKVASELSLQVDWLNPYYSTFAHVLPADYGSRLITVAKFSHLTVEALSKEDLLIMKCFAGRQKDVVHARALVRGGAKIAFVRNHIEFLKSRRIPKADQALDFLSETEAFFAEKDE